MYQLSTTQKFRKSFKKFKHNKAVKIELVKVIKILIENKHLAKEYKDHELPGDLKGLRELHIKPDIFLIYQRQNNILILLLVNIGSHSDLFS